MKNIITPKDIGYYFHMNTLNAGYKNVFNNHDNIGI